MIHQPTRLLKQTKYPPGAPLRLLRHVVITLALCLASCEQQPARVSPPPRPVKYVTVPAAAARESLRLTGEIRAHDETALGFRLAGRVLTRSADIGTRVHPGDVLATLDAQTVENQVTSAQSDLSSARAAERVAALNLQRMRALMPSGAIARAQLDAAVSDWQAALARRESSEATLKTAQENLRWTALTAAGSGVVTGVNVSAGQVVSAGQTVLTVASGDSRDVIIDVADPAAVAGDRGDVFHVSLLSDPAAAAVGHLRDISPQADPQTRTWRVRITLDNPPPAMTLGASVIVTIPTRGLPLIRLPASALTQLAGKPAVFVVDTVHNRVYRRPVAIDSFSLSSVFISAGVTPGERVVVAGVRTLREGEPVAQDEATS